MEEKGDLAGSLARGADPLVKTTERSLGCLDVKKGVSASAAKTESHEKNSRGGKLETKSNNRAASATQPPNWEWRN